MLTMFIMACSTNELPSDSINDEVNSSLEPSEDVITKDDTTNIGSIVYDEGDSDWKRFCVSGTGNQTASIWFNIQTGVYKIYSAHGTSVETTRAYAISWCAEHGNPETD